MKERGMLFKGEMIKAILSGSKTQTRRDRGLNAVNENPDKWEFVSFGPNPNKESDKSLHAYFKLKESDTWMAVKCPYGEPGDLIWARETFALAPVEKESKVHYPELSDYVYRADHPNLSIKWTPSLLMPRVACRIVLKIKKIKIERLNEISGYDALREGIDDRLPFSKSMTTAGIDYRRCAPRFIEKYKVLWESINGHGSWDCNPYLWVVEFEDFTLSTETNRS